MKKTKHQLALARDIIGVLLARFPSPESPEGRDALADAEKWVASHDREQGRAIGIIDALAVINAWRRGEEGEQPSPEFISSTIDDAIELLREGGGR